MDAKNQNLNTLRSALFTRRNFHCFLLIFLCFFLTSAGYLSWLYHLMSFVSPKAADLLTMGGGYAMQAAGIGIAAKLLSHRQDGTFPRQLFALSVVIYAVCLIPACLSQSAAGTVVFGLVMNLFCGLIAAFYLDVLTFDTDGEFRAVLFGTSYAAATIAAWLLSLPEEHHYLRTSRVLFVYFALAAALLFLNLIRPRVFTEILPGDKTHTLYDSPSPFASPQLPLLAGATVVIFSLVKNIGFGFPAADLYAGVNLEASRILYAVGLLIAGLLTEKNRKYGAICAMAALMTPFLILSLSGEPLSQTIFWALDYFVYGFFSIYRIILFSDLAKARQIPGYACFGLLLGRVGDAAGTSVSTLLSGHVTVLVVLAALLFVASIFLFFRLYQLLYAPGTAVRRPSETELFDRFSSRYELSAREQDVLHLLLYKKSSVEIAESLFISDRTVKFHIHNLLGKTGCKNRAELLEKYRAETDAN